MTIKGVFKFVCLCAARPQYSLPRAAPGRSHIGNMWWTPMTNQMAKYFVIPYMVISSFVGWTIIAWGWIWKRVIRVKLIHKKIKCMNTKLNLTKKNERKFVHLISYLQQNGIKGRSPVPPLLKSVWSALCISSQSSAHVTVPSLSPLSASRSRFNR